MYRFCINTLARLWAFLMPLTGGPIRTGLLAKTGTKACVRWEGLCPDQHPIISISLKMWWGLTLESWLCISLQVNVTSSSCTALTWKHKHLAWGHTHRLWHLIYPHTPPIHLTYHIHLLWHSLSLSLSCSLSFAQQDKLWVLIEELICNGTAHRESYKFKVITAVADDDDDVCMWMHTPHFTGEFDFFTPPADMRRVMFRVAVWGHRVVLYSWESTALLQPVFLSLCHTLILF